MLIQVCTVKPHNKCMQLVVARLVRLTVGYLYRIRDIYDGLEYRSRLFAGRE